MDRLIDPVLADLQAEYRDARAHGRIWKSRWVRVAGYVSLLKAVSTYGCHRFLQLLHDWPADDRFDNKTRCRHSQRRGSRPSSSPVDPRRGWSSPHTDPVQFLTRGEIRSLGPQRPRSASITPKNAGFGWY
jgi:hypothetical protein